MSAIMAQGFVKVANTPVSTFSTVPAHPYVGAAWVDVDNDGDIDLFAAPNRLFENLGGGNFVTKSTVIGADFNIGSSPNQWVYTGTTWADVENDGDLDCYLAYAQSKLYLNDGKGNFTALENTPPGSSMHGWSAAFADFNADGYADIALANPGGAGSHGEIFVSNGPLKWTNSETNLPFTQNPGPYTVPTWADLDDDGDFDLFVAAGPAITPPAMPDFMYWNRLKENGSASLESVTDIPFALEPQDGQSYSFVDYDNDGDLDVCLSNYRYAPNRLYQNNGNRTWSAVNAPFTSATLTNSLSNIWGDVDNDGDLDVIFTRDNNLNARLFLNDGNGGFTLDATSPVSLHRTSTGGSLGDYDNDGDLDLFLNGPTNPTTGRALFRNDLGKNNHWATFTLRGEQSNRAAIGAKVRVKATIKGRSIWLRRDISAQNTFQGHNDLRVHFGLGDATTIEQLEIRWPSGVITACNSLNVDEFYEIQESSGCITGIQQPLKGLSCVATNPVRDIINLHISEPQPTAFTATIYTINGGLVFTSKNELTLSLSTLPLGAYLLVVESQEGIYREKIIKI